MWPYTRHWSIVSRALSVSSAAFPRFLEQWQSRRILLTCRFKCAREIMNKGQPASEFKSVRISPVVATMYYTSRSLCVTEGMTARMSSTLTILLAILAFWNSFFLSCQFSICSGKFKDINK
jgi:hypothetical protein